MASRGRKVTKFWDKPLIARPTASDLSDKSWKHFIPFRPISKDPHKLPLVDAGFFNFATIHWMTKLMLTALRRGLTEEDLYDTPWLHKAEVNADRFQRIWNHEIATYGEKKASVARAVLKMVKYRLLTSLLMTFIFTALDVIAPTVFVYNILRALGQDDKMSKIPLHSALLILTILTRKLLLNATWVINFETGVYVKGGVLSCVFKKVLSDQIPNQTIGQLVNLCSNDGQRLYEACTNGIFTFSCIVAVTGSISIIIVLGPWGILGFVIFFTFLPLQTYMSRLIFQLRSKVVPITDERVRLMSEIINSIKLVKMYAWEKSFAKKIHDIRSKERITLTNSLIVQSLADGFALIIPLAACTITFVAMTLTGEELTTTKAFLFISLLNSLRLPIKMMPKSNKALSEAKNACDRLKKLLVIDDERSDIAPLHSISNVIEIRNGYFGWTVNTIQVKGKNGSQRKFGKAQSSNGNASNTELVTPNGVDNSGSDEQKNKISLILTDINFSLRDGALVGVCGSVGSGKTSLLFAVLNMMRKTQGELAIDESKKIAYVPQQAWIMNTTVRENILFGKEYNSTKYKEVVKCCSLENDFLQFPAGDQTEIGERGVNLSGGQKQRVSLARAVYSDSDIILLDDPLSAVDAHIGKQIFEQCISGVLKAKTILFITHQLQFLRDCEYILVMKDGSIKEEGTHSQLMDIDDGEYCSLIKTFYNSKGEDKPDSIMPTSPGGILNQAVSTRSLPDINNSLQLPTNKEFRKRSSSHSIKSCISTRCSKVVDSPVVEYDEGSVLDLTEKVYDDDDDEDVDKESEALKLSAKLTKDEKVNVGSIKASAYRLYIKAAGGVLPVLLVALAGFTYITCTVFSNYWLSLWINDGAGVNSSLNNTCGNIANTLDHQSKNIRIHNTCGNTTTAAITNSLLLNPKLDMYRLVYGLCLVAITLMLAIESFSHMKVSLLASSSLHDQLFRKVVASPVRYFDVTPCGQILNRFSRDMDEVDTMLPIISHSLFNYMSQIVGSIVVICIVFYYFLAAMVPITIMFFIIFKLCLQGIRDTKRIENMTRSPLYSHIATTMQGVTTIRAYKKEDYFYDLFNEMQDKTNMAMFTFRSSMRWSSLRLDLLSLVVVFATTLLMTFMPHDVIMPAYMALALSYAIKTTGLFQVAVRLAIDAQARFTSVERIQDYIQNLESEAPSVVGSNRPDSKWPQRGSIKFTNVEMRYRDGLPLVLKKISFNIEPLEKIGIVGRTGAGKSSIGLALFRIVELASGSIIVDDVDITKIGLHDLRSKLSIIPQDPVLFIGTVRYNLDPFDQYNDVELWEALSKCHIKSTIMSLPDQLNTTVVENGENFSVGERQLLCMARALLRHSRILVLDEATAAIDTETDALIQTTIKEAFTDCTMLTIAHRLNTVMNYDKILVLDNGEVIEFDTPPKLLANKTSVFAQMVQTQESHMMDTSNTYSRGNQF